MNIEQRLDGVLSELDGHIFSGEKNVIRDARERLEHLRALAIRASAGSAPKSLTRALADAVLMELD